MTTETDVKKKIVAYLNTLPACYHIAYHNVGYGRRGVPDRLVCYRGRFLALEVKRPPEERKPNPEAEVFQEREISAICKAGGRAVVVWSVDQVAREIFAIDAALKDISDWVDSKITTAQAQWNGMQWIPLVEAKKANWGDTVELQPDGTFKTLSE